MPSWAVWIELATSFILALTLATLVWYAWETRQLRLVTEMQVRGASLPVVSLRLQGGAQLILTNSGFGIARRVELQGIEYREPTGALIDCQFKPIFALGPNSEVIVEPILSRREPGSQTAIELTIQHFAHFIAAIAASTTGFTCDLYAADWSGRMYRFPVQWNPAKTVMGLTSLYSRGLEPEFVAAWPHTIEPVHIEGKSLMP